MEQNFACSLEHLIEINQVKLSKGQVLYTKFKRIIDFVCACFGLVLLIPVFLVVAAAIKLEAPKEKVFYLQDRVGRNGKLFKLYKFRSMRSGSPVLSTSEFVDAENYITKVGKFIRKTSIDELPQLWNVMKGDMSLVGPRPLLKKEDEVHFLRTYYGIYQVRPGITGLAQTNGRDDMDNYNKVRWDRTYVQNISFSLDLKILWRTAYKVIKREGVLDEADAKQVKVKASSDLTKEKYNEVIQCYSESK